MAIDLTEGVLWRVLGFLLEGGRREQARVEVFPGIGFYARPPASGKPEAIVLNVGGAEHPVVVATRDEKTRAAAVADVAADESAQFNTAARVHVKADGTIEARTHGGVAIALPTMADIAALKAWADLHRHGDPVSGLTTTPVLSVGPPVPDPAPSATGTTKFKAE